jgi:predicted porin
MSPGMAGVSFGLGHVFGEDGASTTSTTDGDKTEGAVFYSGGPVNVAGSYRTSNGSGAGTGEKMKEAYVSGNFSFGIGKVYALVGSAKGSSGDTTDLQFVGAGVSFKLGGNDLVLQGGQVKDKETSNSDSTLLGVSYWHSIGKGATLYAQYGSVSNDPGAARAPWVNTTGSTGFTQVAGVDFSGVLAGLNYKF